MYKVFVTLSWMQTTYITEIRRGPGPFRTGSQSTTRSGNCVMTAVATSPRDVTRAICVLSAAPSRPTRRRDIGNVMV